MKKYIVLLTLTILTFSCGVIGSEICNDDLSKEDINVPMQCLQCSKDFCQDKKNLCIDSDACQNFKICYLSSAGHLVGDGDECAKNNEPGARIWRDMVQCTCEHCCDICGTYCDTEYGILEDLE